MRGGGDPRQPKHDEDEGPVGPVAGGPELVPEADHHGQDAQHYDHWHVDNLGKGNVALFYTIPKYSIFSTLVV